MAETNLPQAQLNNITWPVPLLYTKLHIPRVRTDLVSRPRLTEQLEAGLQRALTLISAPAGSGKTTLVIEWQQVYRRQLAWVSLDAGDNDPVHFISYLIAALNTLEAHLGRSAIAYLNTPQPPSLESSLALLLNDLLTLQRSLILVLDDYHLIEEPAIHRGLTFLLENLPPKMHLIITSRTDSPLPLARLRSRDLLTEFRAADLRFIPHEGADFLNKVMGLNLSAGDVAALEGRTEGWIAGLQFAALSLRSLTEPADRHQFIKALSGRDRHLVDYLVTEVLQHQTPAVQNFLRHTAILERMNGPLCDAVTGEEQGQATLEFLDRANLFLIPLDNERRWYRYHHLFADLLRYRLQQQVGDAGLADLHRRASGWFEGQRLIDEAIHHALAAADYERAATLMESVANQILQGSELLNRLTAWVAALPARTLKAHPSVLLVGMLANSLAHNIETTTQYLALFATMPDLSPEISGWVDATQANFLRNQNKIPQAMALLDQATARLPDGSPALQIMLKAQLAVAYLELDDLNRAAQLTDEVIAMAKATHNSFFAISGLSLSGDIARSRGRLQQAADIYREAIRLGEIEGGPAELYAGLAYVRLGELHQEWNQLTRAASFYERAATRGKQGAIGDVGLIYHQAQVFFRHLTGELTEAKNHLQQLHLHLQRFQIPEFLTEHVIVEADFALRIGDLSTASRKLQQAELHLTDRPPRLRANYGYRILVQLLLAHSRAEGDPAHLVGTTDLLQHFIDLAEAKGHIQAVIQFQMLQALVYQAEDQGDLALKTIEYALKLAQPGGYLRLFLDEGLPMAELLAQAGPDGLLSDYTQTILDAFESPSPGPNPEKTPTPAPLSLPEPLTDRELDVLHQIAAGLSNQEIADTLIISINTVRAHIRNIYGKLQVNSRTQAIAQAKKVGLLAPED